MTRYQALHDRLRLSGQRVVALTFAELDRMVPGGLPASARIHRAWWSNELGETRHTQSRHGWMAAGYTVVGVDFVNEVVTFNRQA